MPRIKVSRKNWENKRPTEYRWRRIRKGRHWYVQIWSKPEFDRWLCRRWEPTLKAIRENVFATRYRGEKLAKAKRVFEKGRKLCTPGWLAK